MTDITTTGVWFFTETMPAGQAAEWRVDVASSRGLGRRDRTTADALMQQTARLAGLP